MSDTATTFTADEVRRTAQGIRHVYPHWSGWADMLNAYASRLEQDDINAALPILHFYEPSDLNSWTPSKAFQQMQDRLREEGRREILREIAKMYRPDWLDVESEHVLGECVFCGHQGARIAIGEDSDTMTHEPTCLYLRAQQATQP